MKTTFLRRRNTGTDEKRRGVFFVLAIISLLAAMTFVGMSVDLGMITVTQTRMQSTADAAALAAVQEIVVAIRQAGEDGVTDLDQVHALSAAAARDMAEDVVSRNGLYIDPQRDVELGRRTLNEDGVTYTESWGTPPYNVVRVTVRKTNSDSTAPDAKLPLMFAPAVGERTHSITADATAFIDARDIVAVLDYSGSMTFDSVFRSDTAQNIGIDGITASLDDIWDALVASDVRFSDAPDEKKFPAEGFGLINSAYGTYISSSDTDSIFEQLELGGSGGDSSEKVRFYDYSGYRTLLLELGPGTYNLNDMPGNVDDDINSFRVPEGFTVTLWDFENEGGWQYGPVSSDVYSMGGYSNDAEWIVITGPEESSSYVPFPQEGKDSSGYRKGKPSRTESESMWKDYINYVKNNLSSYGYRKRYGYRTLMHYLISQRKFNSQSEDLWRAPIYPFHATKTGMGALAAFLQDLGYGDHLGLVTYASTSKIETGIDDDGADTVVDLNGEYLTRNVVDIYDIHRQHQSAHYGHQATGIGYGLEDARDLLDMQGRENAQKAILLMTDGQSNQYPSGWGTGSLPPDWDWNEITDFDGDGTADLVIDSSYVSGGNGDGNWRAALHSFVRAKEASDAGYVIHAVSVGDGADTVLMNAIAKMSGGLYIHIPSGTSNEEIEDALQLTFTLLAGRVPPARLLVEGD